MDLFEPHLIPYYCVNLCCPWAAMYHLMDRLTMVSSSDSDTSNHLEPFSIVHSFLTCPLPCCLSLLSIGQSVSSFLVHHEPSNEQQQQQQQPPQSSNNAHMWFPVPHGLHPIHEEEAQVGEEHYIDEADEASVLTLSNMAAVSVCASMVCVLPTICWIRRTINKKYHGLDQHSESLWQTGLITCLAWPCALTQMQNEIHYFEASPPAPLTMTQGWH